MDRSERGEHGELLLLYLPTVVVVGDAFAEQSGGGGLLDCDIVTAIKPRA